ncbi:MAG TPA: tetratricopeptide repeat protein [Chthonomonadaceae bacterium]|nr:tetratricopeptide repeat protein [Chthonomonadaceae bacterium]
MSEAQEAGYQALQQGDTNTAILRLEQAVQQAPEDYLAHLYLGAAYGQAGRHGEAVQALTRAVQLEPANAQARYNLGIALERAGWREQAITALQQALQLQPDYARAREAMQRIMPPPAATLPAAGPPPAMATAMPGGYGMGYGYPRMPSLTAMPCRLCGVLVAYGKMKCPRCEAPFGLIADPNNAIPSFVPVGGYPPPIRTDDAGKVIPPEVARHKWNWGAFGLSGIWCMAHGMSALGLLILIFYGLGFVPGIQIVIIPIYILICIYLGARGSRLAWQYRRYTSAAQFVQTERIWGYWGMGLSALVLLPMVLDAIMALTS